MAVSSGNQLPSQGRHHNNISKTTTRASSGERPPLWRRALDNANKRIVPASSGKRLPSKLEREREREPQHKQSYSVRLFWESTHTLEGGGTGKTLTKEISEFLLGADYHSRLCQQTNIKDRVALVSSENQFPPCTRTTVPMQMATRVVFVSRHRNPSRAHLSMRETNVLGDRPTPHKGRIRRQKHSDLFHVKLL